MQPIKLWPAVRWGATIREGGEERWRELRRPFALIGSHPRCDIVIAEKRLPPVVYLAVLYGERIELWPLCAIAFPVWGPIKGKPQIAVGKAKIRFVREGEPEWPSAANSRPGDAINEVESLLLRAPFPNANLAMDWGAGNQLKPISRPVSILGEGHPSLIRLHGIGLRTCELGIICAGPSIWTVQLNPTILRPNEPIIRQLSHGGESLLVGNLHLWANRVGQKAMKTYGLPHRPAIPAGQVSAATSKTPVSAEQSHPNDAANLFPSATVTLPRDPSSSNTGSEQPSKATALEPAKVQRINGEYYVQLGRAVPQSLDADTFSTTFTNRLLQKTNRRAFRENLAKWLVATVLMFCALLAIGYILIHGILPIVDSIFTA